MLAKVLDAWFDRSDELAELADDLTQKEYRILVECVTEAVTHLTTEDLEFLANHIKFVDFKASYESLARRVLACDVPIGPQFESRFLSQSVTWRAYKGNWRAWEDAFTFKIHPSRCYYKLPITNQTMFLWTPDLRYPESLLTVQTGYANMSPTLANLAYGIGNIMPHAIYNQIRKDLIANGLNGRSIAELIGAHLGHHGPYRILISDELCAEDVETVAANHKWRRLRDVMRLFTGIERYYAAADFCQQRVYSTLKFINHPVVVEFLSHHYIEYLRPMDWPIFPALTFTNMIQVYETHKLSHFEGFLKFIGMNVDLQSKTWLFENGLINHEFYAFSMATSVEHMLPYAKKMNFIIHYHSARARTAITICHSIGFVNEMPPTPRTFEYTSDDKFMMAHLIDATRSGYYLWLSPQHQVWRWSRFWRLVFAMSPVTFDRLVVIICGYRHDSNAAAGYLAFLKKYRVLAFT